VAGHIGPVFGNWPVGKITVLAMKEFLAGLEKRGIGAATRQKCRSILHRVLQEAVENGELVSNPAAAPGTRVKLPQAKKARILTPVELANLVEAATKVASPSDALAIEVMFFLGLRIGEMAGLQARDFDAATEEITIQRSVSDVGGKLEVQDATKSNRYRVLPVVADLPIWQKLLAHLQSSGLIGKAPVFSAPGGGVIRPNNWRRRVWNRAMDEAKIEEPPSPHSGRRTTASLLSAAGVPQATIQAILGHATLHQTGEYIHVSKVEMQAGFEKLAALSAPRPVAGMSTLS
jgi:integrase